MDRQRDREEERQTDRETDRQTERQTGQTDRQTNRQTDQTDIQTDKQTDRPDRPDRHRQTTDRHSLGYHSGYRQRPHLAGYLQLLSMEVPERRSTRTPLPGERHLQTPWDLQERVQVSCSSGQVPITGTNSCTQRIAHRE